MIDFILTMLGILMVIILDGCLLCCFIWLVLQCKLKYLDYRICKALGGYNR